ncbi:WD40 repeat-like protein [Nadsonia fulvescens var. elongata DSM 6958]|uniref:WD40 repeat-like protein n=1 Tax=Nadsonia fulvescens var. elongata DSM 6958 TaxID=857566 RepID=A0A1E3PLI6_9ASCO|nr:WD40 repeat-like protein [Nadsonia fulvescens var. elongata DSM 6958]
MLEESDLQFPLHTTSAMVVVVNFRFLGPFNHCYNSHVGIPDLVVPVSWLEDHQDISGRLDEHGRRFGGPHRGLESDYQFELGEQVCVVGVVLRQVPRGNTPLVIGYRLVVAPRIRSLHYTRWISSVSVNPTESLGAVGSYDGLVRLWENDRVSDKAGFLNYQLIGHDGPVRAVKWSGYRQLVSGSTDKTVLCWAIPRQLSSTPLSGMSISVKPVAKLVGHSAPISRVAVMPNRRCVLASSDNGEILQWALPAEEETNDSATDYTTTEGDDSDFDTKPRVKRCRSRPTQLSSVTYQARLMGHHPSVAISGLAATDTMAYTSSHDHSLRIWDLTLADQPYLSNIATWYSAHAITALEKLSPTLVAVAGGAGARHLTLYDTRQPAPIVVMAGPAHAAAITQIAKCESGDDYSSLPFEVASASHDGTVQFWDWRFMGRARAGLVVSQTATTLDVCGKWRTTMAPTSEIAVFDIDWTRDGLAIVGQASRVDLVDM